MQKLKQKIFFRKVVSFVKSHITLSQCYLHNLPVLKMIILIPPQAKRMAQTQCVPLRPADELKVEEEALSTQ